ncbi:hypothetical protein V3C99_012574 [Haemonchus contortus]|uniref:ShTK domain protein n=1 Tax=Haemonchus contortus TaxID=6289 RepID=A0A7I4Y3R9_HAECO
MPYWDSTLDQRLPTPRHSVIWSDELLGAATGDVNTGAFRGWLLENRTRVIRRNVGGRSSPMNESEVQGVMNAADINVVLSYTATQPGCPVARTWRALEFVHGKPHNYVGGDMVLTSSSANEPVFFLHHSFVDLIWETFRQRRQSRSARERTYPPDNTLCSATAHFSNAPMRPFGDMVNTDGLSNRYTDIFYTYSDRVGCSAASPSCRSRYLFCDYSHGWPQCVSKIVLGGDCSGFVRGEDCCYNGRCVNERCVPNANNFGTRPSTVPGTRTRPFFLATSRLRSSAMRESENCLNENECCSIWSQNGYCTSNPSYMNVSCKASCGLCASTYDINDECADRSSTCPTSPDECKSRKEWMKENCRRSCSFCNQTREQACTAPTEPSVSISSKTITLPTTLPGSSSQLHLRVKSCTDHHFCCGLWSTQNLCADGSAVQQACPMSCKGCKSDAPRKCLDFHSLCGVWAESNLCNTRKDFMWENCKFSCRKCDLLKPSDYLSACQLLKPPTFRKFLRSSTITPENLYVTLKETPSTSVAPLEGY